MPTDISMASNALMLIGEEPINALSENKAAENLYATTYEYVLTESNWSFAMKEQYLSRLTATPATETGYQYAFQMPSDCLRMWAIMPASLDYRIVGDLLYSSANKLLARYIYKVSESELPPHFVKTVEYKLAADFAMSVADDPQKAQLFEQKYLSSLSISQAKDAQQHPYPGHPRNPIRLARGRR